LTKSSSRLLPVLGLLLLAFLLAGCGGTPAAENWPGLTLEGGMLYVISGLPQRVYLLEAETGAVRGTFLPQGFENGIFYWSPVTVAGGTAFAGFADIQSGVAGLYAFDPETGQELWHVPANDLVLPAPAYADGVVYFGDSDGRMYAVDVEARALKPGWTFEAEEAIWASPLVEGQRVYVASMDHHVYALDTETGEVVWSTRVGGAMAAAPTLDAETGTLYVGAFDGRVHALRADTGELVDGFDFRAENWIWSEVLVTDDRLYTSSLDGRLYALDPQTGEVLPPYPFDSRPVAGAEAAIRSAPVQAGDNIVVGTEAGRVIAVRDGRQQWTWPSGLAESAVYTTAVVADGRVYVVLMNGKVQALDASTGAPGWSFVPPESN
jgi:eukaryotic-like serine/threonine-protein kinase